jgi:hypothetical protein
MRHIMARPLSSEEVNHVQLVGVSLAVVEEGRDKFLCHFISPKLLK